jgi:isopenicillin N synthase-like dioxygenase
MMTQSRLFFELPLEKKREVEADHLNRGYTPFQEEVLDPDQQSIGDTKEGYYIGEPPVAWQGAVVLEADPSFLRHQGARCRWVTRRRGSPSTAPTSGPTPSRCPAGDPPWRGTSSVPPKGQLAWGLSTCRAQAAPPRALLPLRRYFEALQALGLRMVQLMCRALDLPPDYLDRCFTRPMAALRLLHYSSQVGRGGASAFTRRWLGVDCAPTIILVSSSFRLNRIS